jgi:hypothetical protein
LDKVAGPLSAEELSELVPLALEGDKYARNELIVGHLSMLRHTVGRYLYHWPLTRRFLDEMVSAGVYGMTYAVQNLVKEALKDKTVGLYILHHIYKHIESEICALRGIAPAPLRTNQRRVEQGLCPSEYEQLDVIFDPENWGKTNVELSDLTGVPHRTVSWYRAELFRRYLELITE